MNWRESSIYILQVYLICIWVITLNTSEITLQHMVKIAQSINFSRVLYVKYGFLASWSTILCINISEEQLANLFSKALIIKIYIDIGCTSISAKNGTQTNSRRISHMSRRRHRSTKFSKYFSSINMVPCIVHHEKCIAKKLRMFRSTAISLPWVVQLPETSLALNCGLIQN